jgi:hypothetical protein
MEAMAWSSLLIATSGSDVVMVTWITHDPLYIDWEGGILGGHNTLFLMDSTPYWGGHITYFLRFYIRVTIWAQSSSATCVIGVYYWNFEKLKPNYKTTVILSEHVIMNIELVYEHSRKFCF